MSSRRQRVLVAGVLVTLLGVSPAAHAGKELAQTTTPKAKLQMEQPPKVEGVTLSAEDYPSTDGSTSAQPLGVLLACGVLRMPYVWTQWHDGSRRPAPLPCEALKVLTEGGKRLNHTGTHSAYENLIRGKADLIFVAREPSEDELKLAKEKRVTLDVVPIALDAFVFLVNKDNPVKDLTTVQIKDIYTGKITNWKEVGGPDRTINAYQRDRNSGSQELMEKLFMKGEKMAEGRGPMILLSMMGPINRLAKDKDGIGYSVYYFARFMSPSESLELLAVDGVAPTSQTIREGTYAYVTKVFAAVRRDATKDSAARKILDWLTTPAGQSFVASTNYVPLPSVD